jgi:hypothetical protein
MKNIVKGGLATALFVAPFLLFCVNISSCGNGPTPSKQAMSLNSSPDTSGGLSKPRVVITCLNGNCASLTLPSHDTSGSPGGPKIILEGKTTVDIPANTDIRVEVYFDKDSTYAPN